MSAKIDFFDIKIGMSSSFSKKITIKDVRLFSELTGDNNPLHLDEDYGGKSIFKKPVAHGMLSSSYFSKVFGTQFPGNGCIYLSQKLVFKKPVFLDEVVTATVTVTSIDVMKRRVVFLTECRVADLIVTSGEAEIYVPRD